jgi:preprotein translocase subunit SecG
MIVLGILLIIFSLFLIVAVLLQQGKNHNLSGTIAGGAETFFGKSKAQTMNKKLSVLTTVAAVIFVVMVIVVYCVNTPNSGSNLGGLFGGNEEVTHAHDHDHAEDTTTAAPADTTTAPVDTTTAPVDTTTAPAK